VHSKKDSTPTLLKILNEWCESCQKTPSSKTEAKKAVNDSVSAECGKFYEEK